MSRYCCEQIPLWAGAARSAVLPSGGKVKVLFLSHEWEMWIIVLCLFLALQPCEPRVVWHQHTVGPGQLTIWHPGVGNQWALLRVESDHQLGYREASHAPPILPCVIFVRSASDKDFSNSKTGTVMKKVLGVKSLTEWKRPASWIISSCTLTYSIVPLEEVFSATCTKHLCTCDLDLVILKSCSLLEIRVYCWLLSENSREPFSW